MNKRQAKIAAELINGSYLAGADTPDEILGVSEADHSRIITAVNDMGWAMLHKHGLERMLTTDQAVAFALASKPKSR